MRIPFVKTSLSLLLGISVAIGQDAQPSPDAAPSASPTATDTKTSSSGSAGSPANGHGSDTSAALDYLMNRKPQDGSAGKQALDASKRTETKAIAEDAVGIPRQEDSEMRARFERYLGTAQVSQEKLDAYFAKMKKVSTLLRDNQVFPAWKELHDLADETIIDAGISRELANRVESIWNTGRANISIDQKNEKLRKDVKTANANADLMSESIMDKEIELQRKLNQGKRQQQGSQSNAPNGGVPQMPDGGSGTQGSVVGLEGKLQLTEEYLRSLELRQCK